MLLNTGMNTGGYTCAFCGYYVIHGQYHYCSGGNPYVPQYSPQPQIQIAYPDPVLIEIRDLLKQLIELMEKTTE